MQAIACKQPKEERLYLRNRVETLFSQGNSFVSYPYRVVYLFLPLQHPILLNKEQHAVEVLISAPKKRLKKAVDRNRCKRVTREAYRLNKQRLVLYSTRRQEHLLLALLYVGNEMPTFNTAQQSIRKAIAKIIKQSTP